MNCLPRKKLIEKSSAHRKKPLKTYFRNQLVQKTATRVENPQDSPGEKNFNTIRFSKHGSPRIKKISIKKLISGVFWFGKRAFSMHRVFVHREMNYRTYPNGKSLENKVKKFTTPFFLRKTSRIHNLGRRGRKAQD